LRYYFYIVDGFGREHRGAFTLDEGEESIFIAKEIALEKVKKVVKNRIGPKFEPKRVKQLVIANYRGFMRSDEEN
jgi:hypothetical protein